MTIKHICMFKDCGKQTKPDTDDGNEEVRTSHSICEECLEKHYPEKPEEKKEEPK